MSDETETERLQRLLNHATKQWNDALGCVKVAESRCAALEALAVELAGTLEKIASESMDEGGCYYTNRVNIKRAKAALSSPLLAELRAKEGGR